MLSYRLARGVGLAFVGLAFAATTSFAQDYPSRPIAAYVAYGAGGGTDVAVRALVRYASEFIGEEITVENRTGGAGAVGMTAITQAIPDGHTFGAVNFELLTFEPLGRAPITPNDFRMLMKLQASPSALTVRADSPWTTLDDFLTYARENPGAIDLAASPTGTSWNVAAGLLEEAAGIDVNVVPFDGGAQAVTAILGGQVDATTVSAPEVIDHVRAGTLRILATMTEERLSLTPDVPTMKEAGLDIVFGSWTALAAPKDIPDDVYQRLSDALKAMYDDPRFQEFAETNGLVLDYVAGPEFADFLVTESESVKGILRAQGHIE